MGLFGISFGGSGKKDTSTTQQSTGVDPWTQAYLQSIGKTAQGAGAAGPSPLLNGAADYGTAAQAGGNLGFGALSGDPAAVQRLMDPYTQQVIDQNDAGWQKTNLQTANQVNDAATRAGAFGGSRAAVTQGAALASNNQAEAMQRAGLLQSGYQGAMTQAGQLAGYGFQGANMNSNLGFGGVGSPDLYALNMLRQGFVQPLGQNSSGVTRNTSVQGNAGFSFGS